MNTFLISGDFEQCARVLDLKRLSRQIQECTTIAKILYFYQQIRDEKGNIPYGIQLPSCIKLWITQPCNGYNGLKVLIPELRHYFLALHTEWEKYRAPHKSFQEFNWESIGAFSRSPYKIEWSPLVFSGMRSKLLEKDFTHYKGAFQREGIEITEGLGYFWESPIIR